MKTKKLTVEEVMGEIGNAYVESFRNDDIYGESVNDKILKNLLEQIQDELLEVIYDTEKRYVIKTFSKYLNEKGGK